MIWKVGKPLNTMPVQLADIDFDDQSTLRVKLDKDSTRLTLAILDDIKATKAYELISDLLPSDKVHLYFEQYIKNNVYSVLRTLYMSEWHQSNYGIQSDHNILLWPDHKGLGFLLQDIFPSHTTRLAFPRWYDLSDIYASGLRSIKRIVKTVLNTKILKRKHIRRPTNDPCIAVHIIEGVDYAQKSDLFWYTEDSFNPSDIVIVFKNRLPEHSGARIPEKMLQKLDDLGIFWVCLNKNIVERKDARVWKPSVKRGSLYNSFTNKIRKSSSPTERLVQHICKMALKDVDYWSALYQEFNVKIYADVQEGELYNIAQCIALDISGGIRVGWQRSESRLVPCGEIGYHPNHVYFTWNQLGSEDAKLNRNRINYTVISGFPYRSAVQDHEAITHTKEKLSEHRVKLTIALFDNFFWWGGIYSLNMMTEFYKSFLQLVINDKDIAIVTKSKKPAVFQSLSNLKPLIREAEMTGRWINLPDTVKQTPLDAAKVSDISIGIGISSAISEVVSKGHRGIHLDLNRMYYHPLYRWGHNQVVFDDLKYLLEKLKVFKSTRNFDSILGEFGERLVDINPFQDSNGYNRISEYLQFLLRAFKNGDNYLQALDIANTQYRENWGFDKITSDNQNTMTNPTDRGLITK